MLYFVKLDLLTFFCKFIQKTAINKYTAIILIKNNSVLNKIYQVIIFSWSAIQWKWILLNIFLLPESIALESCIQNYEYVAQ